MNTETQAEALRLANALEDGTYLLSVERDATAAEMRRLHIVEQAFQQWITKTEWVQKSAQSHELGMHRADVIKQRFDQLLTENQQLRADLEAVGAGGVGPLMPPPAIKNSLTTEQPNGKQDPAAWRCCPSEKCAYRQLHPHANCPRKDFPTDHLSGGAA